MRAWPFFLPVQGILSFQAVSARVSIGSFFPQAEQWVLLVLVMTKYIYD